MTYWLSIEELFVHITLLKTQAGFVPADPATEEWSQKTKLGSIVHSDFKRMRSPKFHRRYFALLNLGFSYWNPGEISSKYGKPEKNFDQFRADCQIIAGYYHTVVRLDGSVRIVADSISFSNMDEDTFRKLYNNVLTVIMERIPVLCEMNAKEIDDLVDKVIGFA